MRAAAASAPDAPVLVALEVRQRCAVVLHIASAADPGWSCLDADIVTAIDAVDAGSPRTGRVGEAKGSSREQE